MPLDRPREFNEFVKSHLIFVIHPNNIRPWARATDDPFDSTQIRQVSGSENLNNVKQAEPSPPRLTPQPPHLHLMSHAKFSSEGPGRIGVIHQPDQVKRLGSRVGKLL